MSPRRRTFSFILIFISLNPGPAVCQTVGSGVPQGPVQSSKEFVPPSGFPKSQLLNTLLTIATAKGVLPNVLPAIQKIFPESKNLVTNEGIPQEEPNGRPCQQCFTPNLVATPPNTLPPLSQSYLGLTNPYPETSSLRLNEGIPADVTNDRSCQQCFTPNLAVTNPTSSISKFNLMVPNPNGFLSYPILPPAPLPTYPISTQPPIPPTFITPSFIPRAPPIVPPIPVIDQTYNSIGSVPVMGPVAPQPNCNFPNLNSSPSYLILPPAALPPYPISAQPPIPPTLPATPFIPQAPQIIPPVPIINQNYNSIGYVPIIGPVIPQSINQGDFSARNCNLQPEIIQPHYNMQIPELLPPPFPITRPPPPILPSSSMLPSQNIGSCSLSPEPNILPMSTSEPIEVPSTNVRSNTDTVANCGQQLPLPINLQITMPAPVMPEPIITVISTSSPSPEYNPPFSMPPVHVVEKSRSKWKSLLPIMLLALLDGGCGNCGGGCCGCGCCGSNIPIPYPIPIPTNNPIVMGCQSDD